MNPAQSEATSSLAKATELKQRSKNLAIRIVNLFRSLSHSPDVQTLGKQLLRSGTSVGANYRAVCRARSKAEFISRMSIVVGETGIVRPERTRDLLKEANELVAIFGASLRTSKQNRSA